MFIRESSISHWDRVTHICVGDLTIIGSDNGLSPARRQAFIWTNAALLSIRPQGKCYSEIVVRIQTSSVKEIHMKMSSGKRQPFCLGLNVLEFTPYCYRRVLLGQPWWLTSDIMVMITGMLQSISILTFTPLLLSQGNVGTALVIGTMAVIVGILQSIYILTFTALMIGIMAVIAGMLQTIYILTFTPCCCHRGLLGQPWWLAPWQWLLGCYNQYIS